MRWIEREDVKGLFIALCRSYEIPTFSHLCSCHPVKIYDFIFGLSSEREKEINCES